MGKHIRRIVLLLLLAIAVYLGIRFYPVWKAAKYLSDNMDFAHYSYELEVELDQEEMQREQGRLLEILTGVTGFEPEAMCRLTVRGSVWEDTIHALIYPSGADSPLIELYLGSDTDVVNETYIYNAVRNHLAEKVRLLGLVMPEQKEALYMTLEQVEEMFGLDLRGVRGFSLQTADNGIGVGQYFAMLAVMDREKSAEGSRFTLETERVELEAIVPESDGTDGTSAPVLRLHMDQTHSMEGAKFTEDSGTTEETQFAENGGTVEGMQFTEDSRSTKETQSAEGKDSMEGGFSGKILHFVKELTGLDGKVDQIFSQMGFPVSGEQLSVVKNLSVTIVPGGNEIIMPTNYIDQNVVELISRIRELVMRLGGGNAGETGDL